MENDTPRRMPNVPPFVKFVCANVPMVFDDSLSYYEALCALWKYVQGMTDVINNNATLEEEYIEKFNELNQAFNDLKTWFETYFDNLDVQEEINIKLDQMAEDGVLAQLLNRIPQSELNFKHSLRVPIDETELYEGASHAGMQGFCKVDDNYVIAFRNHANADNYVRLLVINKTTGNIVRQTYLTLNHANAISYNAKLNCLYVASCAKIVDGVYTYDDDIFVVDYATLTITKTIQISNIPDGHRIRSVWYDNDDDILYAGDEHEMFIIDELNETITETIELETTGLDLTATNQTFKKIGNYYVGVYISFLAFWDMNKKLVKISNINLEQDGEYIGEIEDCDIDEVGNIVIGCADNDSPRIPIRNASFYESNLYINNSQLARIMGATTTSVSVYVDENSAESKEDGTSNYPFKSLQRAVNYAMLINRNKEVIIKSGSYDYCYIHGIDFLSIGIAGAVTIDGLEVTNSNVVIYRTNNDNSLTVNGISARNSNFKTEFGVTINKFTRSGVIGADYNLYTYFSTVDISEGIFVGDNTNSIVNATYASILSLRRCTFSNYDGYYAVEAKENSAVYTYELTLDKVVSDTEHNFKVMTGARLFTRGALYDKNNFVIESQGMKYPTEAIITPEHTFYGTLCTVDNHYNHVLFRVKLAGANSDHTNIMAKISDLDSFVVNTTALVSTGITFGKLELTYNDETGVLSINKSSSDYFKFSDNSHDYGTNSSDAPSNTQKWCKIEKITFLSL